MLMNKKKDKIFISVEEGADVKRCPLCSDVLPTTTDKMSFSSLREDCLLFLLSTVKCSCEKEITLKELDLKETCDTCGQTTFYERKFLGFYVEAKKGGG